MRRSSAAPRRARPGRAAETKSLVAIAVGIKQPRGFGLVRMQRVDAIRKEHLIPFITGAVEPGATVHTDGNQSYLTVTCPGGEDTAASTDWPVRVEHA